MDVPGGGLARSPLSAANYNNHLNSALSGGGGNRLRTATAARPWDPITVHASLQIEIISGEPHTNSIQQSPEFLMPK
jgi:hypothetical protein